MLFQITVRLLFNPDCIGPITDIIKRVVSEGFSVKDVESAFDKLWSDGLDMDDKDYATESIITYLKVMRARFALDIGKGQ